MEKWFKFYSIDYLVDGKMRALTAAERSCWITLLCLADMSDIPGEIRNTEEHDLMVMSGIEPNSQLDEVWDHTKGVLEKFKGMGLIEMNNGLITVCNFRKRQGKALNTYQRVKKFRLAQQEDNENETESNEVGNTLEENKNENRIEENNITPREKAKEFFTNPEPVILELIAKGYPEQPVRFEVKKFINYWTELNSTGKKQKWQMQSTFEVNRRLATWFGNVRQFAGIKPSRERKIWKQPSAQK